jgi:serine phosphatase RsbU (regulator of sigma subunit)
MKHFLYALAGIVMSCLLVVGAAYLLKPNALKNVVPQEQETVVIFDSLVAQAIANHMNPEFSEAQGVLDLRSDILQDRKIDSILVTLPEQTVYNIASVCKKKHKQFTLADFYDEYNDNKNVYDALPVRPVDVTVKEQQPAMEEPRVTKDETLVSATYKDTMIGGAKHVIETKLLKQNE